MDTLLIQKYITKKRFSKYTSLAQYEDNLLLSKRCYIPLSVLEVSLRNAINLYFEQTYGGGWIINEANFLQRDHIAKIQDAKQAIRSRGEDLSKDKIIAELSFGFWVNLFRKSYDKQMRLHGLKQIFSNLPPKEKRLINRSIIFKELNRIRNFRNRVFHHERVINKPEYEDIDMQIELVLLYLDKSLLDFAKRTNSES